MNSAQFFSLGSTWSLILIAVAANVMTNAALKKAADGLAGATIFEKFFSVVFNPYFMLACVSASILLGSFVLAIRNMPVSTVYILVTSLAVFGLLLVDSILFGSAISGKKVAGTICILIGVFLVAPKPV